MSETLLFKIPAPAPDQDSAYSINWYQSDDGFNWGSVVDSILISQLVIDDATGKYRWYSANADPTKYHELKTVSIDGFESTNGFILPPRPKSTSGDPSTIYADRINTGSNVYSMGETVELLLDVEEEAADFIGQTILVYVQDPFGGAIDEVNATRVGLSTYAAQWKIPKALSKLYNKTQQPDPYPTYRLIDKWLLPGNTYVQFGFDVNKLVEEAVTDNCEYELVITGVTSSTGDVSEDVKVRFTTALSPFYSTVNDVRTVMEEEFSVVGDFDLVREIMNFSKQVDLHMKPEKVHLQDQYDFAVRMYVRYAVAKSKLMFLLAINAESKEIDTFKYSKNSSGDPKKSLAYIDDLMQKYSYIIYAGGKDTPFIPKTFSKGIYDPNRTEANRAGLDVNDPYPWTNTTTVNSIINLNGNMVELRGTRTVAFLKNRASYPNSYSRTEGML